MEKVEYYSERKNILAMEQEGESEIHLPMETKIEKYTTKIYQ